MSCIGNGKAYQPHHFQGRLCLRGVVRTNQDRFPKDLKISFSLPIITWPPSINTFANDHHFYWPASILDSLIFREHIWSPDFQKMSTKQLWVHEMALFSLVKTGCLSVSADRHLNFQNICRFYRWFPPLAAAFSPQKVSVWKKLQSFARRNFGQKDFYEVRECWDSTFMASWVSELLFAQHVAKVFFFSCKALLGDKT